MNFQHTIVQAQVKGKDAGDKIWKEKDIIERNGILRLSLYECCIDISIK